MPMLIDESRAPKALDLEYTGSHQPLVLMEGHVRGSVGQSWTQSSCSSSISWRCQTTYHHMVLTNSKFMVALCQFSYGREQGLWQPRPIINVNQRPKAQTTESSKRTISDIDYRLLEGVLEILREDYCFLYLPRQDIYRRKKRRTLRKNHPSSSKTITQGNRNSINLHSINLHSINLHLNTTWSCFSRRCHLTSVGVTWSDRRSRCCFHGSGHNFFSVIFDLVVVI